ncbi:MAG TPA: ComEC/Rec2 family competence protein, partial [Chroococcales cyanobacterium]
MIATEISWAKLTVAVSVLAGAGVAMQLSNCSPLLALLLPIVLLAALVLFDIFGSGERLRLSARGWAVACLAISVLPGMYFYTGCRLPAPAFNDLAAFTGRTVFFSARILSLRQLATDRWQLLLAPAEMHFPRRRQLSGKTVMTVSAGQLAPLLNPDAAAGRTITVRGLVSAPAQSKNAWEFDQCEFLKRSGVFSVVRLLPASAHDGAGASVPALTLKSAEQPESGYLWCNFEKLAVAARVDLVAHHRQYLGERLGDLLSSIVLGDKAVTMERGVIDRFRDIGLSHLLAASGFNMTIVIATTYFMARFICPSLLINNLISFSAMVVYVSLSGMSASIMRASIMCSILLIARSFSASLSIGAALALALLLTIASQPQAITDVGLQLSYLATAGIVSGAAALTRLLSNGSRRKWRLWLAEGVAVVVIAEASVIPVQLVHFWQVGLL